MPHLFVGGDEHVPGGVGGLDDGEVIWNLPLAEGTQEEFEAAPIVGWLRPSWSVKEPQPVRLIHRQMQTMDQCKRRFVVKSAIADYDGDLVEQGSPCEYVVYVHVENVGWRICHTVGCKMGLVFSS